MSSRGRFGGTLLRVAALASGVVCLGGCGLLADLSSGMTQVDPPTIEMPPGEGDPPTTAIMNEMHETLEPPTRWIDLPVTTQCAACEEWARDVRTVQLEAARTRDELEDPSLTDGEVNMKRRSIWAQKRQYDRLLVGLAACERENCPPRIADATERRMAREQAQVIEQIDEAESLNAQAKEKYKQAVRKFGVQQRDEVRQAYKAADGDKDRIKYFTPAVGGYQLSQGYQPQGSSTGGQPADDDAEPYGSGFFYIPGTNVRLEVSGRARWFDSAPQAGFGTVVNPEDEVFLGRTDDELDGYQLSFAMTLMSQGRYEEAMEALSSDWLPPDWDGDWRHDIYIGGFYGEADGDSSAEEPIGERDFAITYFEDSPSGATGAFFGDTGATFSSETDYTEWGLLMGVDVGRRLNDRTWLSFRPHLGYQRGEWEHNAWARSLTFTDSYSSFDEEIDEDRIGVGIDARLTRDLGQGFYGFVGTGVGVDYGHADLDWSQDVNIPVNPVVSDRMFSVDGSDSEDYAALNLSAEIGVGYRSGPWSIAASAGAEWTSDVPEAQNRANPADDSPTLDTTDQTRWTAGLKVGYSF